jgi:hypothetical protein
VNADASAFHNGYHYLDITLWVPETLGASGDLPVLLDQAAEAVTSSDAVDSSTDQILTPLICTRTVVAAWRCRARAVRPS